MPWFRQYFCYVAGCTRPHHAEGLCHAHYDAWYRKRNPKRVATYNAKRRKLVPLEACKRCGGPLPPRRRTHCSDKCAKGDQRDRYRAKLRLQGRSDSDGDARKRARRFGVPHEPINRERVFKRDGYRCQLCGRLCKRKAMVPDMRAPTLDHIVPMSQGGPHQYANVQCACFKCNVRKGNGAANDQLLLLG